LHRRSEEIVLTLDWLPCRGADPNDAAVPARSTYDPVELLRARVPSSTGLRSSGDRDCAVIVAMSFVRMTKVSSHEIVFMTTMRNRFMSATSTMQVLGVMSAARMSRGTGGWIRSTLRQCMFIDVPLVGAVKMSVMQIVDVTFVFDRGVAAAWTMRMGVLVMRFVVAHVSCLLPIDSGFIRGRKRELSSGSAMCSSATQIIFERRMTTRASPDISPLFSLFLLPLNFSALRFPNYDGRLWVMFEYFRSPPATLAITI
jgi:hypothetical protein